MKNEKHLITRLRRELPPGVEAFQSITHAKLTLWSVLGGGTKTLAGAILPSACVGKRVSGVCSARWLTPSAEQKKRECYESDSRRGYAIKRGKSFEGVWGNFLESFPIKIQRELTYVSGWGGGTQPLAGAILPSACERNKLSRVCAASTLLPSAEHEKRNRYESGSRRG